jgi:hypothetical protein
LTPTTEIQLQSGERLQVEGDAQDVEATILAAARGSIMQLAWFTEVQSGDAVAVNPDHVVLLRVAAS